MTYINHNITQARKTAIKVHQLYHCGICAEAKINATTIIHKK